MLGTVLGLSWRYFMYTLLARSISTTNIYNRASTWTVNGATNKTTKTGSASIMRSFKQSFISSVHVSVQRICFYIFLRVHDSISRRSTNISQHTGQRSFFRIKTSSQSLLLAPKVRQHLGSGSKSLEDGFATPVMCSKVMTLT